MKRVLVLGAGVVAKPLIEYLIDQGIRVLIASPMKEKAEKMLGGSSLGTAIDWSMDDPETLDFLIGEHDITVSLLPFIFQPGIAAKCLKYRRSLVTTTYIQPGMLDLHEEARRAGVIFLNEMGFDPGIDHMTARKIIDHIHSKGGITEELYSFGGALPAPEAADNPLGYKFTLSPKGVILAGKNGAQYLRNGQKIIIEPEGLFRNRFKYHFPEAGDLEVYPNQDSISYLEVYDLHHARTIYRGTFRYPGWCETFDAMIRLNLLDDTVKDYSGLTYAGFLAERSGCPAGNLKHEVALKLGISEDSPAIKAFEFLELFSDEHLAYKTTTPFHITSDRMISRMALGQDERDMVILQHIFLASYPGGKKEIIKSSMTAYGTPSTNTAISRTIALPAAIAVRLILENRISLSGVYRPVLPEIYNPVLDELKSLGISMKEEFGLPPGEMIDF